MVVSGTAETLSMWVRGDPDWYLHTDQQVPVASKHGGQILQPMCWLGIPPNSTLSSSTDLLFYLSLVNPSMP